MILGTALNNAVLSGAVGEVPDEIWDEPIQEHQQDGSTGEALEQARVAALNAAALSA